LISNPSFLIVDEPTANLDESGKSTVFDIIEQRRSQAAILIATNEPEEAARADHEVRLG
jgi:ABC-type multidrug transport system ATPase subunit